MTWNGHESECVIICLFQWLSSPALPVGVDMDRCQADSPDHVWAQCAPTRPANHQHRWKRYGNLKLFFNRHTILSAHLNQKSHSTFTSSCNWSLKWFHSSGKNDLKSRMSSLWIFVKCFANPHKVKRLSKSSEPFSFSSVSYTDGWPLWEEWVPAAACLPWQKLHRPWQALLQKSPAGDGKDANAHTASTIFLQISHLT